MPKQAQPEQPAGPEQGMARPFEENLKELEAVVKQLEGADLPLERALELFERGMQLSQTCRKQLNEAEMRVEILMKRGNIVEPRPFDTEAK
jgi:exodeoxyribonuclease VII small subunit